MTIFSCGGGTSLGQRLVACVCVLLLAIQVLPQWCRPMIMVVSAMEAQHRIWPAAQVELYTTTESSAPSGSESSSLLSDNTILLTVTTPLNADADRSSDYFLFEYIGHYQEVEVILHLAKQRFFTSLQQQIPTDNAANKYPINPKHHILWPIVGIQIRIATTDHTLQHNVDESYALSVPPIIDNNPYIQLEAPTVYGVLHGLQSVLQLLQFAWIDNENQDDPMIVHTISHTPLYVYDAPLYPYRGLLIDTSRHYLPLSLIVQNLNAMEMNKLNVLHWHLTDRESWPYHSKLFPELTHGAFCEECVYNATDIQHVIDEAANRGIRVILEVDLPGHSQSIGASHPEFLTECGKEGRREPLDVTQSQVVEFVTTLYHELNGLVVDDWIHIGGDEVSLDCWKVSTSIQRWMHQHNVSSEEQLLSMFEHKLLQLVTSSLHKTPIVWQEVFDTTSNLQTIPSKTVIDVWKEWDTSTRDKATAHNYRVIYSACWYLDHLNEDWQSMYKCDPRDFNGTQAQLDLIIGGHASMWGEKVDEHNFMSRVYPRASTVAEKLWTGTVPSASDTAATRLDKFRCLMVQRGIDASPIQPGTCEQQPNPIDTTTQSTFGQKME